MIDFTASFESMSGCDARYIGRVGHPLMPHVIAIKSNDEELVVCVDDDGHTWSQREVVVQRGQVTYSKDVAHREDQLVRNTGYDIYKVIQNDLIIFTRASLAEAIDLFDNHVEDVDNGYIMKLSYSKGRVIAREIVK